MDFDTFSKHCAYCYFEQGAVCGAVVRSDGVIVDEAREGMPQCSRDRCSVFAALASPAPLEPGKVLEGVKRYYHDSGHDVGGPGSGMHESKTGEWMREADVLRALQKKEE